MNAKILIYTIRGFSRYITSLHNFKHQSLKKNRVCGFPKVHCGQLSSNSPAYSPPKTFISSSTTTANAIAHTRWQQQGGRGYRKFWFTCNKTLSGLQTRVEGRIGIMQKRTEHTRILAVAELWLRFAPGREGLCLEKDLKPSRWEHWQQGVKKRTS